MILFELRFKETIEVGILRGASVRPAEGHFHEMYSNSASTLHIQPCGHSVTAIIVASVTGIVVASVAGIVVASVAGIVIAFSVVFFATVTGDSVVHGGQAYTSSRKPTAGSSKDGSFAGTILIAVALISKLLTFVVWPRLFPLKNIPPDPP